MSSAECRFRPAIRLIVPFSPASGHKTLKLVGLIQRKHATRSTMVCLLPAGRAAIEKAAPGHVEDVRRNFIDLLTPAELDMLATLNERILHHLATNHDSPAEDEPS